MGTPGAAGGQKGSKNSHASKQAILKVKIGNVVSFVIRIVTPVVFFIVLIFCPFSGAFEGSAGVKKGPNRAPKRLKSVYLIKIDGSRSMICILNDYDQLYRSIRLIPVRPGT